MRCVSCGEDIPPKWVAVIEKNVCPSCDGPIMTDDAIQLKDELAEALAKMPNDPQGVTGWLLSNYRVQKIGESEPVERFNRPGAAPQQPMHQGNGPPPKFNMPQSPYEEYLARTGMKSKVQEVNASVMSKRNKMAEMAANISGMDDPYGDPPMNVSGPSNPEADQEDYAALQAMIAEANGTAPALPPSGGSGNSGALSPDQIMMMQKRASHQPHQSYQSDMATLDYDGVARSNVGYNDGDLSTEEQQLINRTGAKGHKIVMENRLKRIKGQEAVESGGGSFTRAG